ncbi:hypothetical protein V1477_017824 [Vespula maculifrons]|uniref:Ribosomal protein S3 n=1 Tax=Vespula maculifrons TaxID=7453 RepID=A0ABD2B147_VESMC
MGPIGADTQENRSWVIGKGSSRPVRTYFFRPDRTNRSQVITHLGEPDRGNKGKKHFPLTIFFSETIAPRRTGPGSLERARLAVYAHIFFVQIGPIGADTDENLTGVIRKDSSRPLRPYFFIQIGPTGAEEQRKKTFFVTIFFSETIAPRRTGPGSLERARRVLYARIFFVQIGPIGANTQKNRSGVIGKGSSRPLRPYFFRPDRTNRSRVITHLGEPDRGHSKGLVPPSMPIFFSSRSDQQEPSYNDWTNRSRVITEPSYKGLKEQWKKTFFFNNFFLRNYSTEENRSGVIGKESSRPLRPYFFRPDRTNRSRVITEPSYNGLKEQWKKTFFFNNFFLRNYSTEENRTGVIGKESSRPLRPYFFRPDRTNRSRVITEPSYKGLKEQWKKTFFFNNFFLRNYSTEENRTGVIGKESSRPLRPYFFRPDRTNRSRVITEPSYNGLKEQWKKTFFFNNFFLRNYSTEENRTGVIGKESSRPLRPYFFRPDRTNRSRVITIGPIGAELYRFKGNKGKKHFSLTIFFSETIAPRRT